MRELRLTLTNQLRSGCIMTVRQVIDRLLDERQDAKVWIQSRTDRAGSHLHSVETVKSLGDEIETPGAREDDVVIRFHE